MYLFSRPSVGVSVRNILFLQYFEDPMMEFQENLQASQVFKAVL